MDDLAHMQVTAVHWPDVINANRNTLIIIMQLLESHYAVTGIQQVSIHQVVNNYTDIRDSQS